MQKSISAEPHAETQDGTAADDRELTQQEKPSAGPSQPHLRIVHSTERPRVVSSAGTQRERARQAIDDRPPAMLDRAVQAQIGRMLRDVFSGVADEPVPDRFVTLLAKLAAKEKTR